MVAKTKNGKSYKVDNAGDNLCKSCLDLDVCTISAMLDYIRRNDKVGLAVLCCPKYAGGKDEKNSSN